MKEIGVLTITNSIALFITELTDEYVKFYYMVSDKVVPEEAELTAEILYDINPDTNDYEPYFESHKNKYYLSSIMRI